MTVRNDLAELDQASQRTTRYATVVKIMDLDDTRFIPELTALYFESPGKAEGPGERLYRQHHGLDVNAAG